MYSAPIDSDDLLAIRIELKDTNDENDRWFRYELHGAYAVVLDLAPDSEQEGLIHVRVSAPPNHEGRIIVAIEIANSFELVGPTVFSE